MSEAVGTSTKLIIYNLPLQYTKDEIRILLFEGAENELISSFKLFKHKYKTKPKSGTNYREIIKRHKAVVVFKKLETGEKKIEEILGNINGLKLDDEHTLKAKRGKEWSVDKYKSHTSAKEQGSVSRDGFKVQSTPKKKEDRSIRKGSIGEKNSINVTMDEFPSLSASLVTLKPPRDMAGVNHVTLNRFVEKGNLETDTIFVKNIHFRFKDLDKLAKYFQASIQDITMPKRRFMDLYSEQVFISPDLNCGYVIVRYPKCDNIQEKVKQFNRTTFEGRQLKVTVARKRKKSATSKE